jgi:tetratricopeptide (TPR) repeat protein
MQSPEGENPRQRLDSWKEIAAFFDRDERTVNRWEKTGDLPVHRLPGIKGRVYAYTDELSEWLKASQNKEQSGQSALSSAASEATTPKVTTAALDHSPVPEVVHNSKFWKASGAAFLLLVVACLLVLIQQRSSSAGAIHAPSSVSASTDGPMSSHHEAEQLYLTGRFYWNKRTREDLEKAVDSFTQAIVKDPSYSAAYVGLADCYNLLQEFSAMPEAEAFPKAYAAAQKAVELDDNSAEAHASLGFSTFYWRRDPAASEREFKKALAINPNYVAARQWYATVLMTEGRADEALAQIEQAQKLDPGSRSILADKGIILFRAGRADEAIALLRNLAAEEPDFVPAHRHLSSIYLAQHDYRSFLSEWDVVTRLVPDPAARSTFEAANRGYADGTEQGMLKHMLQNQKSLLDQNRGDAYPVAQTYSLMRNRAEALRYLSMSRDRHEPAIIYSRTDDCFESLHQAPEFRAIVSSLGFVAGN